MTLLATLLNHQIVEKLYSTTFAGINYRCSQSSSGIAFTVTGFNQKMHLVFDIFGKTLKSLPAGPTEAEFNVFVQQQLEIYEKEILDPEIMADELQSSVFESHFHPLWDRYRHLRSISFLDFQQFCRSFCEEVHVKASVRGNIRQDHAIEILTNFLNDFQCERNENLTSNGYYDSSWPKKLPIGAHYLRVKNLNANDANSFVKNFYQIVPGVPYTNIVLDLLEMIATEPVYDILRNKQQLAYYVSFGVIGSGINGYYINVNSQETKFTTDYVDERIENFRRELLSIIERMSLDDFDTFKNSLAKNKWIECDKMAQAYKWYWWAPATVDDAVVYLLKITKAQLLEMYRTSLDPAHQRKLSIQVIGNAQAGQSDTNSDDIGGSFDTLTYVNFTGEPKGNLIEDLMKFGNSLEENIGGGEEDEDEDDEEDFEDAVSNSINTSVSGYFCCFLSIILHCTFY